MTLTREALMLTPEAFEARFSDLVELICDAAHVGHAKPFMEAQYTVLQAWMQEHLPLLESAFSPQLCEAFTQLFRPTNLTTLLAQDDGTLMSRLLTTQDAVGAWKIALTRCENP